MTRLDPNGSPLCAFAGDFPDAVLASGELVIASWVRLADEPDGRLSFVGLDGELPEAACTELRAVPAVYEVEPGDGELPPPLLLRPSSRVPTVRLDHVSVTPTTAVVVEDCHYPPVREPSAVSLDPSVEPLRASQPIAGALALTWEDTAADSYRVYRAGLSATAGATLRFSAVTCEIGQPLAVYPMGEGSWSYLASALVRDPFGRWRESSLGRTSLGDERIGDAVACP